MTDKRTPRVAHLERKYLEARIALLDTEQALDEAQRVHDSAWTAYVKIRDEELQAEASEQVSPSPTKHCTNCGGEVYNEEALHCPLCEAACID